MRKIVIIGATSGIGKHLAESYARTNAKIAILGRRKEKLDEIAAAHSDQFICQVCDIMETHTLPDLLNDVLEQLGGLDLMIVSAGTGELNPELKYAQEEPALMTNVLGWACAVDWAMNQFEKQGFGHLASISSVGGLRGSGIAPAYNATKAFQINYMEGLRQKANKSGKRILTTDIRPGFVDTAMAKGDGLFWVSSVEKAGAQIYRPIEKKKKTVYITRRWWVIAFALKHIPSFIYCKM